MTLNSLMKTTGFFFCGKTPQTEAFSNSTNINSWEREKSGPSSWIIDLNETLQNVLDHLAGEFVRNGISTLCACDPAQKNVHEGPKTWFWGFGQLHLIWGCSSSRCHQIYRKRSANCIWSRVRNRWKSSVFHNFKTFWNSVANLESWKIRTIISKAPEMVL